MSDLRLAIRQLLKNPAFALVALLSLALGVGANTAVFSLVNDVLLRSLPVRNPDELVLLRSVQGAGGQMSKAGENTSSPINSAFSLLTFERMRTAPSALSDVFAFAPFNQVNVIADGEPEERISAQLVSGNYYGALGVPAAIGRPLTLADDRPDGPAVAVISFRYWDRRF